MIDRDETNTIIRALITPPCSTLSLQAADLLNRYAVEVAQLEARAEAAEAARSDLEHRLDTAEAKLADEYVAIREHAPAYLNKRVDQYRTRTHGGIDRIEQAIEHLENGSARGALNAMKNAIHVLEQNT